MTWTNEEPKPRWQVKVTKRTVGRFLLVTESFPNFVRWSVGENNEDAGTLDIGQRSTVEEAQAAAEAALLEWCLPVVEALKPALLQPQSAE